MTDTNPRDLIKFLIDALKEECNWIDNPKHDELIAKATAYLTQYEPEVATDEELNSKSSPNNLQIRSSDITPPPELVEQWAYALESQTDTAVFTQAARWGADQELEACISAVLSHPGFEQPELFVELLRAARRPKPPSLKEQALTELNLTADSEGAELSRTQVELIRRALEQLDD